MVKKTNKIRVSRGDGKPVDDLIPAKTGAEAHDLAYLKHPGARNIHVLGVDGHTPAVDHHFFDAEPIQAPVEKKVEEEAPVICEVSEKDLQIAQCLALRAEGATHRIIANSVKIGKSTVARWLQLYG